MPFFRLKPAKAILSAVLPLAPLLAALHAPRLAAQSPFQFREAYLLERRMAPNRGGFVDISHYDENMGRVTPSFPTSGNCRVKDCKGPDGEIRSDLDNPLAYQDDRWLYLLEQADTMRERGAYAVAGPVYVTMIARLRKAQGENSNMVALMLDHLAEYYLEGRNFDLAYKTFEEAIQVRRATITLRTPIPPEGTNDPEVIKQIELETHLADMLTRLGQIDLGKGDLARAEQRLTEAVAIFNTRNTRRLVGSLYAVYFYSLTLEREGKWKEAEDLWKQSVTLREGIQLSSPYWDCLREQAAFYARRGDFHTAAILAQKVQDGTKGKQFRPGAPMPYRIDSRPRSEEPNSAYSIYLRESETAFQEIEAMDKWQTDGPAAAAALLPVPYVVINQPFYDWGADSELAQLIAWTEQRVFLHMSILLDGQPSQAQLDTAYQLISNIKGRYLASIGEVTKYAESGRNNPGVDTDTLPIMDEIGETREYQARLYLQAAMDGKPFPAEEFNRAENVQRILSKLLSHDQSITSLTPAVDGKFLSKLVPEDAAFLDFVEWKRSNRDGKTPPQLEYGAFVIRHGLPVHYVRLGPAESIDKAVDALKAGVLGNHTRGFLVETHGQPVSPEAVNQQLKAMYAKILAPLENDLRGATQLLIVPDGKLTLAPISGLIDSTGHFLFEKYTITLLNSARDMGSPVHFNPEGAPSSVVVANPDYNLTLGTPAAAGGPSKRLVFQQLPGAELEAKDIQASLKVPAYRVLTGPASRKWLIQSITSPEILHFATHTVPSLEYKPPVAEYNLFELPQPQTSQNPLIQSIIALAGANRAQSGLEDGILTGLEVSRLHLTGTSLVVLSTCESGQGTPVEGLGVLGLRAAFSMAGAKAVLMTLWPVDDAAGRQFMDFFYSHLPLGPAAALRQAQIDMLAKTQYKNPFYWSGYVVSGGPEGIDKERPAPKVPASAGQETFVTPRCFDFAMSREDHGFHYSATIRLKIGGDVYRKQDSPNQVTWDLTGPGNTIVERTRTSVKGSYPIMETRGEGRDRYTGTITMLHSKDASEVSLRFGQWKTDPKDREVLTLRGGSQAFPSLDLPDSFPSPTALTLASDSYEPGYKIDRIAACTGNPTW